jgi:protein phosphatase
MDALLLSFGSESRIGKGKRRNEDSLFTLESKSGEGVPFGLFILADGKGKEASELATRVVAASLLREVYLPFLTGDDRDYTSLPINEALTRAMKEANESVHNSLQDATTTLTCVLILGENAYISHVGDCRVYIISKEGMRRVTKDHSLVERLVELEQISPEEATLHPKRNILYRALGKEEKLEVDTYLQPLRNDCFILLCSDGLWSVIPEEEMKTTINSSSSPEEACKRLTREACERGEDDVTAVLIQIS